MQSNIYAVTKGSAYDDYARNNRFADLNGYFIAPAKPRGARHMFNLTFQGHDFGVYVQEHLGVWYVSSKTQNKKGKPTVCAVFFAPSRFADQLMSFSKPFLEKGWKIRSYNAALTPRKKDSQRAAECAKGADLLILTSLQWADKTNINQKNAINGLIKENKNTVFISTMSPYDIKNYPEADVVLATYGLNKYALQTAAHIILGNLTPRGRLPVDLQLPPEPTSASAGDERSKTHTPQAARK